RPHPRRGRGTIRFASTHLTARPPRRPGPTPLRRTGALACGAVLAALALTISLAVAPKPHVVWKPIPYGPSRKAEMARYAERHYGIHSWRLHPKVIVEHYTGSNSFSAAW